jgi:hypothetical protein
MIDAIISRDFNIMSHIKYVFFSIDINNGLSHWLIFDKSHIFPKQRPLLLHCVR